MSEGSRSGRRKARKGNTIGFMRVVVLLGGDSPERDVSIASGAAMIKALRSRGHVVSALDPALPPGVSAEPSEVNISDRPSEKPAPLAPDLAFAWLTCAEIRQADVVVNALHGASGEDGTVQALMESAGITYTGSGVLASALAMNKDRAKALFRDAGVPIAAHLLLDAKEERGCDIAAIVSQTLGFPVIVKPNCQGSSVGFSFVREESQLQQAIIEASRFGSECMVERYIPGREITAAVLEKAALPLVEIVPDGGFYDYKRKYTKGASKYIAPADLPSELAERIQCFAVKAFEALECRDYARVDFRLAPSGEVFCLELNTLPGMTELSLVPMAARAAGISFEDLVERICMLALARKK